jgi:hypothetical protein
MATTTNLAIELADVGADNGTWGNITNAAFQSLDDIFKTDGTGSSVSLKVGASRTLNATDGAILLPAVTTPAQTADGSVVWDSDSNLLTVGDGASRKTMCDTDTAQTLTNKTLTTPVFSGNPTGTVTSGTYTPSYIGVTNVSSATARVARWVRIGSQVFVSGQISLTLSGSSASLRITLPVATTFGGNTYLCAGSGSSAGGAGQMTIVASSSTDDAFLFITSGDSNDYAFTFAYTVV